MEWWLLLALLLAGLAVLLLIGVPVAIALLAVNVVAVVYFFGVGPGASQLIIGVYRQLASFVLLPVLLFIIMGEVLFRSGVAGKSLEVLDRMLGQVPGRLGLLATGAGALGGVLSGSTMANTALLGTTLLPEMERQGYDRRFGMGSILASGGLAMIIPPSTLAIVWGATAGVPIGPLLIAGVVPGLLMAANYSLVISIWARFFGGAPRREERSAVVGSSLAGDVVKYVLPLGFIVATVLGVIFAGIATVTEAAALGVIASVVVAAGYRRLSLEMLWESLDQGARITAMVLFILLSSGMYSRIMSFSGATARIVETLAGLPVHPMVVLILIQVALVVLGLFLEQIAIMVVTIPLLMPVVQAFGWDPVWFGIVMLMNLQIALTTPPFGMTLFVMKGVAPKGTKLTDIYTSALPFVFSDVVALALVIAFPVIALWLPGLMT